MKELVQNALDATENMTGGEVKIELLEQDIKEGRKTLHLTQIRVIDNGSGISNPDDIMTVFSTGKEDELLRGRMGQGAKEILCLAREAVVHSGKWSIHFLKDDKGKRYTEIKKGGQSHGTTVYMALPWESKIIPDVIEYFRTFLIPEGRHFEINGEKVPHRTPVQVVEAKLKTEIFEDGRWKRRHRVGRVELVPIADGEDPMIYEMGIPVCPINWTPKLHVNVMQRVPMNPRRDAVASGYHQEIYATVLPVLLPSLKQDDLRSEWVSGALDRVDEDLQKDIVTKALGDNAVRSVPTMGTRHDFDSDARETGYVPINTALLATGLRSAAEKFLPTSREVEMERRENITAASSLKIDLTLKPELKETIEAYRWLGKEILGFPILVEVVPELILKERDCTAAWQSGGKLLLNIQHKLEWINPFKERAFGLLVHETAHDLSMHHGDEFRQSVEKIAGRVARLCLYKGNEIRDLFPKLVEGAA
jgi:hypothetical protein